MYLDDGRSVTMFSFILPLYVKCSCQPQVDVVISVDVSDFGTPSLAPEPRRMVSLRHGQTRVLHWPLAAVVSVIGPLLIRRSDQCRLSGCRALLIAALGCRGGEGFLEISTAGKKLSRKVKSHSRYWLFKG